MLGLSFFHRAAISVELSRMKGLGVRDGSHRWESHFQGEILLLLLRSGDSIEKDDSPFNKGSTCLGESDVSSPDSSHWLDLLGLQGFRGTGLGSSIGNRRHPPTSPP